MKYCTQSASNYLYNSIHYYSIALAIAG